MSIEELAASIFFGSGEIELDLDKLGLKYRKNKTIEDVKKAREKGIKRGQGRTEFELSWTVLYLRDVVMVK